MNVENLQLIAPFSGLLDNFPDDLHLYLGKIIPCGVQVNKVASVSDFHDEIMLRACNIWSLVSLKPRILVY